MLSSPIYSDSPIFISEPLTPTLLYSSKSRPYSHEYRTFELPSLVTTPILSPVVAIDTPVITDTVPVYSDTSVLVTPTYNVPLSVTTPVFTNISTEPDFISPGTVDVVGSPYVTTVDLTYSQPLIGISETISYQKASTDPEITGNYVKHYYYKTVDKWLLDDISSLLNFFTVSGDRVNLIKSMKDYNSSNSDKFTSADAHNVVNHISKNYFSKDNMANLLHKLMKRNIGLNWSDLPRHESTIKKLVKKYIRGKLEEAVGK